MCSLGADGGAHLGTQRGEPGQAAQFRRGHPGGQRVTQKWRYARNLYRIPAFRDTTDFAAFTAPGAAVPN